jgi:hypothetical protein
MIRLAVKLDLSKVPSTLKSIIIHQSKFSEQIQPEPNQSDIVLIQGENENDNDINVVIQEMCWFNLRFVTL